MNNAERRNFKRIEFNSTVNLRSGDDLLQAELIDICMKGALVKLEQPYDGCVGQKLQLSLALDNEGEHNIFMRTEVAHIRTTMLGLKSLGIDVESATNLRKLIELNLGDADSLERDLAALMHSH